MKWVGNFRFLPIGFAAEGESIVVSEKPVSSATKIKQSQRIAGIHLIEKGYEAGLSRTGPRPAQKKAKILGFSRAQAW